ncbi:MAG: hypothetical protein IJY04_00265, partial [Clostridia bacterium]|nr:hypothetical protein [Clostridia bacterium]
MEKILENIRALFWKSSVFTTTTTNIVEWDKFLVRDGKYVYFSDINYDCQDIAIWDALNHLRRMQSKLCAEGLRALDNDALMEEMSGALDYWLYKDPHNPNWWFNQIGMVSTLSAVTIMLRDRLTDEQVKRAAELVSRGSVATLPKILDWTGANLIWGIRNTVHHALLTGDRELMRIASDRMSQEIAIAEGLGEGIKPDMSFYQHGAILYSCGYGRSFTYETAQLIAILSGSEFAIDAAKTRIFEKFLLEGQRYMMRGEAVDFQTVGREIARPGALSSKGFAAALELLLESDSFLRKDELRAYLDSLLGKGKDFTSTKYF